MRAVTESQNQRAGYFMPPTVAATRSAGRSLSADIRFLQIAQEVLPLRNPEDEVQEQTDRAGNARFPVHGISHSRFRPLAMRFRSARERFITLSPIVDT
jgi:hypothetical protein